MYDIKNKRKFLNRTKHTNLPEQLFIGTKLQIHSRQHTIVDFGDDKTRKVKKNQFHKSFHSDNKKNSKNFRPIVFSAKFQYEKTIFGFNCRLQ